MVLEQQPRLTFASQALWEAWLLEHHAHSPGIWLQIAKKDSGIASVSYAEALEGALIYGWIDGQKGSLDNHYWLQRFTPRGRRSRWSKINTEKALELISRHRMHPNGLREVERAQQDGRWAAAYDGQATAVVPGDLQRELDCHPQALAFFTSLDSRNRYAILHRIGEAKKPETRARRIAQYVAMCQEGKKLYP